METTKDPETAARAFPGIHLDPTPPPPSPRVAALTAICCAPILPPPGWRAPLRVFLGCRLPAKGWLDGVVGCAPFGAHRACPKTGVIGGVTPLDTNERRAAT